jgi:hypothetical protein
MTVKPDKYLCDEDVETGVNIRREEIDNSIKLPKNNKRLRDEVVVPQDKQGFIEERNETRQLPRAAVQQYGCLKCEWKGTYMCPFQLEPGEKHSNRICDFRRNYLLSLQRKEKYHDFSEWQRDINKSIINLQASKDYFRFQQAERELMEAEADTTIDREEYQAKVNRAKQLRYDWLNLVQYITTLEDKQVDRDTARKHDVNVRSSISVSEFQKMVNGENEIVDAEYEELDEDIG